MISLKRDKPEMALSSLLFNMEVYSTGLKQQQINNKIGFEV
jgi:hypothetical protein